MTTIPPHSCSLGAINAGQTQFDQALSALASGRFAIEVFHQPSYTGLRSETGKESSAVGQHTSPCIVYAQGSKDSLRKHARTTRAAIHHYPPSTERPAHGVSAVRWSREIEKRWRQNKQSMPSALNYNNWKHYSAKHIHNRSCVHCRW